MNTIKNTTKAFSGNHWIAGLATTAATAMTAEAATVYIDLGTNIATNFGGGSFSNDILPGGGAEVPTLTYMTNAGNVNVLLGGGFAANAYYQSGTTSGQAVAGDLGSGRGSSNQSSSNITVMATGNIVITFSNPSVHGGASVTGALELLATSDPNFNGQSVALTRLYYDDANPTEAIATIRSGIATATEVPEPSGLALLALGAGGLLLRRQRKLKA